MLHKADTQQLIEQIKDWNASRLDLFEISLPNEKLESFGVIRFFYQDESGKYHSKCLRVSNTATAAHLISLLIQKIHPDIRAIGVDKYGLYESHSGGTDRRLGDRECPLLVQLNWTQDDREGKFILKNESRSRLQESNMDTTASNSNGLSYGTNPRPLPRSISAQPNKRRSLSDADFHSRTIFDLTSHGAPSASQQATQAAVPKNVSVKRHWSSSKKKSKKRNGEASTTTNKPSKTEGKPPDSSFTRTLSNTEQVMKRKRQRKLETRLQQISTQSNGAGEAGGTLKIYGEKLDEKVPYKTLLLSIKDTAMQVLQQTLEKYGIDPGLSHKYCLIQLHLEDGRNNKSSSEVISQYRLRDNDCPLGILLLDPPTRGRYMFQVEKFNDSIPLRPLAVPPDYESAQNDMERRTASLSRSTKSGQRTDKILIRNDEQQVCPSLVEVRTDGGEKVNGRFYRLTSLIPSLTAPSSPVQVGTSLKSVGPPPGIVLIPFSADGQDLWPLHCTIRRRPGDGTTPLEVIPQLLHAPGTDSRSHAHVTVSRRIVYDTTELPNECLLSFGASGLHTFRVLDPFYKQIAEEPKGGGVSFRIIQQSNSNQPRSSSVGLMMDCLPVVVDFPTAQESSLLASLIDRMPLPPIMTTQSQVNTDSSRSKPVDNGTFQLVPAYSLYCLLRAVLRQLNSNAHLHSHKDREGRLTSIFEEMTTRIMMVIDSQQENSAAQAFWLANTSELLHFVKRDEELHSFRCLDIYQSTLDNTIEQTFQNLQRAVQDDIHLCLPSILNQFWTEEDQRLTSVSGEISLPKRLSHIITEMSDNNDEEQFTLCHLLSVLSQTMNLLRHCRVNVALTIQLYSQLFHYINQWLFNTLLKHGSHDNPSLLSNTVAEKIHHRLACLKAWALRQGLELAAECHLNTIEQACVLLMLNKRQLDIEQLYNKITGLTSLNSLQVEFLLSHENEDPDDIGVDESRDPDVSRVKTPYRLPVDWIEIIVAGVREVADKALEEDTGGAELQLYEDERLLLPLLLPDDGYSADLINEQATYAVYSHLRTLYQKGLLRNCVLNTHRDALWNAYLNVYENTGPTNRSIVTYEAFGGPGRGSYRRRNNSITSPNINPNIPSVASPSQLTHPPSQSSAPNTFHKVDDDPGSHIYAQPMRKANHSSVHTESHRPPVVIEPAPILKPKKASPSSKGGNSHNGNKGVHVTFINETPMEEKKSPQTTNVTTAPTSAVPSTTANVAAETQFKRPNPHILVMQLNKLNGSLGLSIITAIVPGDPGNGSGVYIRDVVAGGAAAKDGRLSRGDQLLQVDNISLIGADQSEAVRAMKHTGENVTLRVHRRAAYHKNIAQLILKSGQKKGEEMTPVTPVTPSDGVTGTSNGPLPRSATFSTSKTNQPLSVSTSKILSASSTSLTSGDNSSSHQVWTETDLDANRVRRYRHQIPDSSSNARLDPSKSQAQGESASKRIGKPAPIPVKRDMPSKNKSIQPRKYASTEHLDRSNNASAHNYRAERQLLTSLERALADLEDRPPITLSPTERETLSHLRIDVDKARRRLLNSDMNMRSHARSQLSVRKPSSSSSGDGSRSGSSYSSDSESTSSQEESGFSYETNKKVITPFGTTNDDSGLGGLETTSLEFAGGAHNFNGPASAKNETSPHEEVIEDQLGDDATQQQLFIPRLDLNTDSPRDMDVTPEVATISRSANIPSHQQAASQILRNTEQRTLHEPSVKPRYGRPHFDGESGSSSSMSASMDSLMSPNSNHRLLSFHPPQMSGGRDSRSPTLTALSQDGDNQVFSSEVDKQSVDNLRHSTDSNPSGQFTRYAWRPPPPPPPPKPHNSSTNPGDDNPTVHKAISTHETSQEHSETSVEREQMAFKDKLRFFRQGIGEV